MVGREAPHGLSQASTSGKSHVHGDGQGGKRCDLTTHTAPPFHPLAGSLSATTPAAIGQEKSVRECTNAHGSETRPEIGQPG